MYKLIGNSKLWFIISGLLSVASIAFIFIFGLRVGIDYTGGTVAEIIATNPDRVAIIEQTIRDQGIASAQIKESNDQVIIRMPAISNEDHQKLTAEFEQKLTDFREISYDAVGPTIGKDLERRSIYAVILASLGIILYVAYAFRKLPKPLSSWKFGLAAVVALAHDLLITTGLFALIGGFFHWMEVDVLFITALLTIMGFSVHDTIVVYDRLRENFIRNPHKDIIATAEESVNQTLVRSINTSLTVVLVLLSLLILGSSSIRHFIITLILGIIVGTYSSIFVASPVVIAWHKNLASIKAKPLLAKRAV